MNLIGYVANYQHLSTKTRRNSKSHEEKPQTGSRGGTHGRASQTAQLYDPHHGQPWWWLSRVFLPLPECCRLYLFLSACFACVGSFWSSCAIFFDLLGAQKHLLILWFRVVNLNSTKTLKISKTMQNRRNRGTNRIIIHFNPLKWLLNTQLIHANMTLVQDAMSKLPYEM